MDVCVCVCVLQVVRGFADKQRVFEPSLFRSKLEVDPPTTKMYRFHGTVVHPTGATVPVSTDNLLLRECVLKNTDFVEGIVVYAGRVYPFLGFSN